MILPVYNINRAPLTSSRYLWNTRNRKPIQRSNRALEKAANEYNIGRLGEWKQVGPMPAYIITPEPLIPSTTYHPSTYSHPTFPYQSLELERRPGPTDQT